MTALPVVRVSKSRLGLLGLLEPPAVREEPLHLVGDEPAKKRRKRPRLIIPCPRLPQTSNNIIQKGLAFVCERSGSVTVPGTKRALGSCPAGYKAEVGLRWRRQMTPHQRKGDPDGYKTHQYPNRHSVHGFAAQ